MLRVKHFALLGAVVVFLLLFARGAFVTHTRARHVREVARRLACASKLKSLHTRLKLCREEHPRGPLPTVDMLVEQGPAKKEWFICPGSGDVQSNYVIVRSADLRDTSTKAVLAYEPKSNHGGEGGNILFVDGHVEFIHSEEYDKLITDLISSKP